jgi:hypothetical protein
VDNNLTVTDMKGSEEEESSDKELKCIIIRMMNEMNEDMNKKISEFKEVTNS